MCASTSEFVADELKKLVGWLTLERLAFAPHLRRLAGVRDGASVAGAGKDVYRYLVEQIDSLSGSYELFIGGQCIEVEAEKLRWVLRLLLQIEGKGQSAKRRRERAIVILGAFTSVEAWRRPIGPERELMSLLAAHMTRPPNLDQAAS